MGAADGGTSKAPNILRCTLIPSGAWSKELPEDTNLGRVLTVSVLKSVFGGGIRLIF